MKKLKLSFPFKWLVLALGIVLGLSIIIACVFGFNTSVEFGGGRRVTAESKLRKDILINSFNDYRVSLAESGDGSKVYGKEHYFNVHYSNIVYITNYMIFIFSY